MSEPWGQGILRTSAAEGKQKTPGVEVGADCRRLNDALEGAIVLEKFCSYGSLRSTPRKCGDESISSGEFPHLAGNCDIP